MKILLLCKKFPYPLKDGESIAVTYLSKALHDLGCEITLLAMNTVKHFFDLSTLPKSIDQYQNIHTIPLDNRLKIKDAFFNLFSTDSYHVTRFISEAYSEKLTDLLQKNKFDIVQLETPYLAPYIPIIKKHSKAKIVMRAHNVEFEIWERITNNTKNLIKKWYVRLLTKRLKKYEIEQLKHYDLLATMTERDLDFFQKLGYKGKNVIVPIGLDSSKYKPNYTSFDDPVTLGFIGSLDWMPNLEGIQWFLESVMPSITQLFPTLVLHIAGRNAPEWLLNKRIKNVVVCGEVESSTDFINEHSVMIVPLFSGSGMRVKILEGMMLGKVIITTTIGVEGIDAKHNEHIFVADTAKAFVEMIEKALQQEDDLVLMGKKAQAFAKSNYDNLNIGKKLLKAFDI